MTLLLKGRIEDYGHITSLSVRDHIQSQITHDKGA